MKRILIFLFTLALSVASITFCTKVELKDDSPDNNSGKTIEDDIELESMLIDLSFELDDLDFMLFGFKDGRDKTDCKTVTIEPEEKDVFPKTITIDFGDGCEIKEGQIKKGRIIMEVSAAPNAERWTKKIRFDGYAVNNKVFKGGKNITYVKEGRRGLPTWQSNSRVRVHWDEDSFVQHSSERTRVQTRGFDTPRRPMDDAFIISGSGTGINRTGLGYKRTIEEPLNISRDCRWVKKGVVKLLVRGKSEIILDYGEGSCDNIATITKDGESKEIKLKRK